MSELELRKAELEEQERRSEGRGRDRVTWSKVGYTMLWLILTFALVAGLINLFGDL